METLKAKMNDLIVNYLVNQGFYGLDSRGEGTPHPLDDHFKAISRSSSQYFSASAVLSVWLSLATWKKSGTN